MYRVIIDSIEVCSHPEEKVVTAYVKSEKLKNARIVQSVETDKKTTHKVVNKFITIIRNASNNTCPAREVIN